MFRQQSKNILAHHTGIPADLLTTSAGAQQESKPQLHRTQTVLQARPVVLSASGGRM